MLLEYLHKPNDTKNIKSVYIYFKLLNFNYISQNAKNILRVM